MVRKIQAGLLIAFIIALFSLFLFAFSVTLRAEESVGSTTRAVTKQQFQDDAQLNVTANAWRKWVILRAASKPGAINTQEVLAWQEYEQESHLLEKLMGREYGGR